MVQPHPIRRATLTPVLSGPNTALAADNDFEVSIATIATVGEKMGRMQAAIAQHVSLIADLKSKLAQFDEQSATIAGLKKEVADLKMHKDAAYSEMAKSEAAFHAERARAENAERSCQIAVQREQDALDKLGRLIASVRETFADEE